MKTLFILFLLLAAGWYLGLGGCLFSPGRCELRGGSAAEYLQTETAKWIAIPPSSEKVATFRFLAFDTNYRFLMATVQPGSTDLAELCARSIGLQPGETNASLSISTNVHLSGFQTLFGGSSRSAPAWWNADEAQFDQRYLCAWETTNHYGRGFLFLLDSQRGRLQAFQWIQQWNTVSETMNAFGNGIDAAP